MTEVPEPAAGPPSACPNCEAPYRGRYCPECGQDNARTRLVFRPVLLDAFQSFIGWESSLALTLKGLFRDPGAMVADYVAGKRRRYVNPARFALLALASWMVLARLLTISPMKLQNFEASVSSADAETEKLIVETMSSNLDLLLYATLPLQAVFLWLFFRKSGRNLAENMVLVLYVAGFRWILTFLGAPFMAMGAEWVLKLLQLVGFVWLLRASHGFYQFGWFATTWRTVLALTLRVLLMGALGLVLSAVWVLYVRPS